MIREDTVALLTQFADASSRGEAVTLMQQRFGCAAVLFFVCDAAVKVLLPAPTFTQTLPGGSEWRALLSASLATGVHLGTVRYPDLATLQPAVACTASDGTVLVLVGQKKPPADLEYVSGVLPIMGALLRTEQGASAAAGQAAAARESEIHARNLATALDTSRTALERALAEAARLNQELVTREAESRRRAEFEQHLIGIVSHDLRNPLHAIALSTHVLSHDKDGLTERQLKVVGRMTSAAQRANRMIRDLLDFTRARLGEGIPIQKKEMDVHEAIQVIIEELRAAYPQRAIEYQREGGGVVAWDPDRIAQVLTNLVANAIAYSPAHSPVLVRCEGRLEEITLSVHNGGPPIDDITMARLFEPLTRGNTPVGSDARSIGLGLYIVRKIVAAHGGRVEVTSSLAEGTTFVARLPRGPRTLEGGSP